MLKTLNIVRSIAVVAALTAAWALPTAAVAQKNSVPRSVVATQQNQPTLAQNEASQLVLVMHADRGGNILRMSPSNVAKAQPNPLDSTQDVNANLANAKDRTQANPPPRSSLSLGK
jgi:hypothetical protein